MTGAGTPQPFVPDFVIAGGLRSGTTSLYTWLASHPGVAMSTVKEPMFWCPELPSAGAVRGAGAYRALWRHQLPGQITGEATAAYLHSRAAVSTILAAAPSTRFILSLRSPAEVAPSLHALLVRDSIETMRSFEEAWRVEGPRHQAGRPGAALPHYRDMCAIGDQLERFLACVPPPNRHIIRFDALARNPRGAYLRVLDFLGLADDGRDSFPVANPTRLPRLAIAQRLGERLPQRLARTIARLNERPAPPRLRPGFRHELVASFLPQIDKIERLLGEDLSSWKTA